MTMVTHRKSKAIKYAYLEPKQYFRCINNHNIAEQILLMTSNNNMQRVLAVVAFNCPLSNSLHS